MKHPHWYYGWTLDRNLLTTLTSPLFCQDFGSLFEIEDKFHYDVKIYASSWNFWLPSIPMWCQTPYIRCGLFKQHHVIKSHVDSFVVVLLERLCGWVPIDNKLPNQSYWSINDQVNIYQFLKDFYFCKFVGNKVSGPKMDTLALHPLFLWY